MSSVTDREHLLDWNLDLDKILAIPNSISSNELRPAVDAFVTNFSNIEGLGMLPFRVASVGVRRFYWAVSYVNVVSGKIADLLKGKISAAELNEFLNSHAATLETKQSFVNYVRGEGKVDEVADQIRSYIDELLADREVFQHIRTFLLSATTLIWSAFECLAKDMWIAALNSGTTNLGQKAIGYLPSEIPQEGGISRKYVEVGLLAKYGFDVRSHLGDILESKFKFSDLDSIRDAYCAGFKNKQKIEKLLDNENLRRLEATRHVIVHRSGIVDSKFLKETEALGLLPGSRQNLNAPVEIDAQLVRAFANAVAEVGAELARFVDKELLALSQAKSPSPPQ